MIGPTLRMDQLLLLKTILERGAENASQALSSWLGRHVSLEVGDVGQVEPETAIEAIGPPEALVAACSMTISGRLSGTLLLVFEDRAGLALADMLQGLPVGTTSEWGELEQSAAQETANIVGCAYLNALASHLPGNVETIAPGPPVFRHEFAGSLLEFALFDQATHADRVLLVQTRFRTQEAELGWSLLLVPSATALDELARALEA